MKQFTSGEISKLLKVTKGTVLNYEELGMVRSGRNPENGYRYYSDLDLDELLKIRSFRGMGFSLKETQEISHCSQAEELLPLLAKKQAALTEEIARIEQKRDAICLLAQRVEVVARRQDACAFAQSPGLLFLPASRGPEGSEAMAVESAWVQQMPYVTIASILRITANGIEQQLGYSVPLGSPAARALPRNASVQTLLPRASVCRVVEYTYEEGQGYDPAVFVPLYDFVQANGLEPDGDLLLCGLLTLEQSGQRRYYAQVYLPVC